MSEPDDCEIDDWPFDMNGVCEFLDENLTGFQASMLKEYFVANPFDKLLNASWGARPKSKSEIKHLKKLDGRIDKLISNFMGTLGVHNADIVAGLYATQSVVRYSIERYTEFFDHETRGGVNWHARTVADICFNMIVACGRNPTFGTCPTSDQPTGEYCKLIQGALLAASLEVHWNSPAKWAYERNSKKR